MMKKIKKIVSALFILSLLMVFSPLTPVYADRNSPPEESVRPQDESAEAEAKAKKEAEEKAARERRAAEARRQAAAAAKKKADEQRAIEEKKRAAEARRLAAEEAKRRWFESGRVQVENGRYRSALNTLQAFVKENPHSADAWYWIARAHQALGDYDRAQTATNIALEIDPYYPALTKTPSGLQPNPRLTKQQRKEPRPSMSVLPVKPVLPSDLALEPVVISFPHLVHGKRGDEAAYVADGGEPGSRDDATGAYLRYDPYPPLQPGRTVAWQQSEKFNEISRWRFRVDRMGIIGDPQMPRVAVAWKGSHPYEVYFWTGTEWARARRQRAAFEWVETYDDILAHAQESIKEVLAERGYEWNEADTPSLAASASLFRYRWMGDIDLSKARARAEKRAREHFVYDSWDAVDYQPGGESHEDRETGNDENDWGGDDDSWGGGGTDDGSSGPSDNW